MDASDGESSDAAPSEAYVGPRRTARSSRARRLSIRSTRVSRIASPISSRNRREAAIARRMRSGGASVESDMTGSPVDYGDPRTPYGRGAAHFH